MCMCGRMHMCRKGHKQCLLRSPRPRCVFFNLLRFGVACRGLSCLGGAGAIMADRRKAELHNVNPVNIKHNLDVLGYL